MGVMMDENLAAIERAEARGGDEAGGAGRRRKKRVDYGKEPKLFDVGVGSSSDLEKGAEGYVDLESPYRADKSFIFQQVGQSPPPQMILC